MRLMEWIQLTGKTLHGHIYLWRWRSHQSLARKGLRIFRFCVMSWKDEPEPTIQCCLGKTSWRGSKVRHNTELWTHDGEPMKFEWNIFPGFTTLQLCNEVHEFMSKMSDQYLKDESSSCRCSMTSYGDLKTMNGNALLTIHLCLYLQKDSQQDVGHSSDPGQKSSGVYLYWQTTRRMGQSRWIDDVKIRRKRTQIFPCHESTVPRNAQKQRRWNIVSTLLYRWGYDWNCFSHNSVNQLSIYGAVSDLCDEWRTCQARTERLVLAAGATEILPCPENLRISSWT